MSCWMFSILSSQFSVTFQTFFFLPHYIFLGWGSAEGGGEGAGSTCCGTIIVLQSGGNTALPTHFLGWRHMWCHVISELSNSLMIITCFSVPFDPPKQWTFLWLCLSQYLWVFLHVPHWESKTLPPNNH